METKQPPSVVSPVISTGTGTAAPLTPGPNVLPVVTTKKHFPVALILLLPLLAIIGSYFFFTTNEPATPPVVSIPTPINVPPVVQNPGRLLSPIATQSAYLTLEQQVVDLAGQISQTAPQDVRTSPPSLILPLGFK